MGLFGVAIGILAMELFGIAIGISRPRCNEQAVGFLSHSGSLPQRLIGHCHRLAGTHESVKSVLLIKRLLKQ